MFSFLGHTQRSFVVVDCSKFETLPEFIHTLSTEIFGEKYATKFFDKFATNFPDNHETSDQKNRALVILSNCHWLGARLFNDFLTLCCENRSILNNVSFLLPLIFLDTDSLERYFCHRYNFKNFNLQLLTFKFSRVRSRIDLNIFDASSIDCLFHKFFKRLNNDETFFVDFDPEIQAYLYKIWTCNDQNIDRLASALNFLLVNHFLTVSQSEFCCSRKELRLFFGQVQKSIDGSPKKKVRLDVQDTKNIGNLIL